MKTCELPYDKTIVQVEETTSLMSALHKLVENKSTCLLIRTSDGAARIADMTGLTLALISIHLNALTDVTLVPHQPGAVVLGSLPLCEAVRYLAQGVFYICVECSENKRIDVVSHGALLRHLWHKLQKRPSIELPTVSPQPAAQMHKQVLVRQVFRHMLHVRCRCVALVDDDGKAVEVLSLSDARWLACVQDPAAYLELPAIEYVRAQPCAHQGVVITCRIDDSLSTLLETMVSADVHQVFVLDAHGVPTGMVDSGQVIRALL
jgi:CBS domain-containing protein